MFRGCKSAHAYSCKEVFFARDHWDCPELRGLDNRGISVPIVYCYSASIKGWRLSCSFNWLHWYN